MKLENAIKKLEKYGKVTVNGNAYSTQINKSVVEFRRNGRIEDDKDFLKDIFMPHWHTHYIMDEYGKVIYTSDLEGVKARLNWLENLGVPKYELVNK